jgi:dihydropteroate synthase/2-amino-4-hydroxy-6-hydroxymethyldihydropteridine diphosphokinase
MKCFVGLGSNQGDRVANLERAAQRLKTMSDGSFRVSPIYRTPALVPPGAPSSWRIPFVNAVIEMSWNGEATQLLSKLKEIEKEIGRLPAERWAPRVIDLDLLLFGDQVIHDAQTFLHVPHAQMLKRAFVLGPLRDLEPRLIVPGSAVAVTEVHRQLPSRAPLWMGILNLTPDSFSDGGVHTDFSAFAKSCETAFQEGVQIFDLGAESTRPGAIPVEPETEWRRLSPALEHLSARFRDRLFRPRISVDTRHTLVARRALAHGADWINDVSAGADVGMANVVREANCDFVFMHHLSVPADVTQVLADSVDPVQEVLRWAEARIEKLQDEGVSLDRLIFDPGIGFGKTPLQSLEILKRIEELQVLPVRILVGASRKSFMKLWGERTAAARDPEGIGVSLQMAMKGVDVIRVHEPSLHLRAFNAFQEVSAWSV